MGVGDLSVDVVLVVLGGRAAVRHGLPLTVGGLQDGLLPDDVLQAEPVPVAHEVVRDAVSGGLVVTDHEIDGVPGGVAGGVGGGGAGAAHGVDLAAGTGDGVSHGLCLAG